MGAGNFMINRDRLLCFGGGTIDGRLLPTVIGSAEKSLFIQCAEFVVTNSEPAILERKKSQGTLCLGSGLVVVFSDCFEFNHWDIFE